MDTIWAGSGNGGAGGAQVGVGPDVEKRGEMGETLFQLDPGSKRSEAVITQGNLLPSILTTKDGLQLLLSLPPVASGTQAFGTISQML